MDQQIQQKIDNQIQNTFTSQYLPNWTKKSQKGKYKLSYVLTNLDTNKKNVMLTPNRRSPLKLDENIFEEQRILDHKRMQSKVSASVCKIDRYHQGFVAVPINQKGKKYEYLELQDWWLYHKNSLKREEKDMVPICYEDRTGWEIITNSMISPKGAEGRQWWQEVEQFKKGQTHDKIQGYQYDLGVFPYIFKKVKKPVSKKKNTLNQATDSLTQTQRTQQNGDLFQGDSLLQSSIASRKNSQVQAHQTHLQAKSANIENSHNQFMKQNSIKKSPTQLVPKYLPLKVNQKMAAEKSAQSQGAMRLSNGFAARSKTPLILKSYQNIEKPLNKNVFQINPIVNSDFSQLQNQSKNLSHQAQKLTQSKFKQQVGNLSHNQFRKIEDIQTPIVHNRKNGFFIERDGVRNTTQGISNERVMSPMHNEYSEKIEEYLNDNMGSLLLANKAKLSSQDKKYRQVISQSTDRSTIKISANNLSKSHNTGRILGKNVNMKQKLESPFDSLAANSGFLPKNIRINEDLAQTPDLLVQRQSRNGKSINTQFFQQEKFKIFKMLESNRLTTSSLSKRDHSQSKESTIRVEIKDNSPKRYNNSEMRYLDDASYEQQSVRRNQYYDHYFTALSQMGGPASNFERIEKVTTEKLFQKDRLVQKQMSLFQNYGKKMRLTQNVNHGSFKDHLRGSL